MATKEAFDSKALRQALGSFVSGITVITCTEAEQAPVGITVSSFCALSLDPPMVLWCIARDARSCDAFLQAENFAVHVLAHNQWHLAEQFATQGGDKFSSVPWALSDQSVPLIEDCASRFECRRVAVFEGGDHLIVTGEIDRFIISDIAPLAYHHGRYALTHRDEDAAHLMAWQSW